MHPKGNLDPGDLGDDSSTSERAEIKLSEEEVQFLTQIDQDWPPGTVAQLEPEFDDKDPQWQTKWRTVIVLDRQGDLGLILGDILVHDGMSNMWVRPEWLRRVEVAPELGPRMVAHAHATTSPRCSISQAPLWDWLSPGGFSSAGMVEAQLPRTRIAHVIGKGGSKIRRLEEHFGVCIGVHDSTKDEATISVIGPSMQLDFVLFVIRGLAQGASSILTHLPLVGCDALPP